MSCGKIAPRLATIFVTCWAHAEDISMEGSFSSKLIPAIKREHSCHLLSNPFTYLHFKVNLLYISLRVQRIALTHRTFVRDCMYAKGQLFFWIHLNFFPLRECLGYHLALLDALWFIITPSNDPRIMKNSKYYY